MRYLLCITVLVLFFSPLPCAGANYNYTWVDEHGITNITDFPPPGNVEILEVSPIPEVKKPSPASLERERLKAEAYKKSQLLEAAAEKRQEEKAARRKAAELISEADALRSRTGIIHKVKRKYRRWANTMEDEAETLLDKADSLAADADKLEKMAAELR